MTLASSSSNSLAPSWYDSLFGSSCTTGVKALCGPTGSNAYARWVGTAPACAASCSDCNDDSPVCMTVASSPTNTLASTTYTSVFGATCTTGNKVLCGPKGFTVLARWVGTAPACAASCSDCNDDTPVCMSVASSPSNSLADSKYTTSNLFGATCTTGNKALCGPTGSTIYPRWVGTAPACAASCSDCTGSTPVCMAVGGSASQSLASSSEDAAFGSTCTTGNKVLCGPTGSTIYPRWVGTAPACAASCDDCTGSTPVCMMVLSSSSSDLLNSSTYPAASFGADCTTGSKVLCGPVGSTVYPRWVGTAPFCDAHCSDCTGDAPKCMARSTSSSDAPTLASDFGNTCYQTPRATRGYKVLCGAAGSATYFKYPNWMQDHLANIGSVQLQNLTMVGTHDSGMGLQNKICFLANQCNTRTQTADIYEQLMLGVTYFDIRLNIITSLDGTVSYISGHYGGFEIDQTVSYIATYDVNTQLIMGCPGQSFTEIVSQINKFVAEYGQLVVLRIAAQEKKHITWLTTSGTLTIYDTLTGLELKSVSVPQMNSESITEAEWGVAVGILKKLNSRLNVTDANRNLLTKTVNDFIGPNALTKINPSRSGGAVVVILDESTAYNAYADSTQGFFKKADLLGNGGQGHYSNTDDLDTMVFKQLNESHVRDALYDGPYYLLSWTLTQQGTKDPLLCTVDVAYTPSILSMSVAALNTLSDSLLPHINRYWLFPNVLFVDDVDERVAKLAIQLTYARSVTTYSSSYLGCYSDSSLTALSQLVISDSAMITTCVAACYAESYNFAGLYKGRQCYCGKTFSTSTTAGTYCNLICQNRTTDFCGGSQSVSVYSITKVAAISALQGESTAPTVIIKTQLPVWSVAVMAVLGAIVVIGLIVVIVFAISKRSAPAASVENSNFQKM